MRALLMLFAVGSLAFATYAPSAMAEEDGTNFSITLQKDAPPLYQGPLGWFTLDEHDEGTHYSWDLDLPERYIVGDILIPDGLFDVERPQQVVPMVNVSATHYPLFKPFPNDELWTANTPAQVYRYLEDGDDTILRLGFPGPLDGTFSLTKDTAPPGYEIGPVEDLVYYGFYQESTTDELTRADLRIRPAEGGPELENPTPVFAYIQKFPVQGLDPETAYEAWIVFEDWAGNAVQSDVYGVTTPPRPAAAPPTIVMAQPLPNATQVPADAAIQIAVDAPTAESVDRLRLFIDAQRVDARWDPQTGVLTHTPGSPLEEGPHRVSVEVYDLYGNMHHEQWRFWVGPGPTEAAAPAPMALLLVAFCLWAAWIRRR